MRSEENLHNLGVIIPALKKGSVFADDLNKKLGNSSLIERAISQARNLVSDDQIFIITDCQEITLRCERAQVRFFYEKAFQWTSEQPIYDFQKLCPDLFFRYSEILVLYPYTPLLPVESILLAYNHFLSSRRDILISTRQEKYQTFSLTRQAVHTIAFDKKQRNVLTEVRGFHFVKTQSLTKPPETWTAFFYPLEKTVVEIQNYQDWWVCEKLLKRRRIVFRVIGN